MDTGLAERPGAGRVYRYQPALDGVRALAVTAVVLFHAGVTQLPGGFLGVDAFFVLSGFLITSLLLAEQLRDGRIRLAGFWARRARRLLPALLLVLICVVIAGRYLLPPDEVGLLRGDALAALGYVANWRMIYRGSDYFTQTAAPSPLQHTWSLGIEEQFYVVWPLIVVGVLALARQRRLPLLAVALGGAAASAVTAVLWYRPDDVNRAYFGTDSRAQALLIGCALAILCARPGTSTQPRHRVLGALALAGAGGTAWFWTHASGTAGWLYHGGLTAVALAVAAVLAHAVRSPRGPTARVLALPPLVWLGRISYGVYLWHWPLFQFVDRERTGLAGVPLLGLRVALTLGVATASYHLVERP
ncbi:MAG TPA: acyltransferase, partial [Rugosimonospora sp.]|nr:acyltransferase [Rugosimonospora sp.]